MVSRFPYAIYCYIMPAFCLFLLLTCLKLNFPLSGIFVCLFFFIWIYTVRLYSTFNMYEILRMTIEIKNNIPFPICPCVFSVTNGIQYFPHDRIVPFYGFKWLLKYLNFMKSERCNKTLCKFYFFNSKNEKTFS